MKQNPSQLKFKKYQKIGSSLLFLKEQKKVFPLRSYGLKILEPSCFTFSQIEACRKVIKRGDVKCEYKLNVFCSYPITKKSIASRMGKGKGGHSRWVAPVRAGYLMCEICNINKSIAKKILKSVSAKLQAKTKIIELIY